MFGRKKAMDRELVPIMASTKTVTLVRDMAINVSDLLAKARRGIEFTHVLNRSDYSAGISDIVQLERAFEAGFHLFVDQGIVGHFKYAATVMKPTHHYFGGFIKVSFDSEALVIHDLRQHEIEYVGDIPDFAMRRIEKAKRLGINNVTIHSNQPLQVKQWQQVDPVLIGWYGNPHIRQYIWADRCRASASTIGVVIAIWDLEKELNI